MGAKNDNRGWTMACISGFGGTYALPCNWLTGLACILGSSIICIDLLIQKLPGKRDFRIQDSNAFLASSLSLSFGVMVNRPLFWCTC